MINKPWDDENGYCNDQPLGERIDQGNFVFKLYPVENHYTSSNLYPKPRTVFI